jgi:hypothetical protein
MQPSRTALRGGKRSRGCRHAARGREERIARNTYVVGADDVAVEMRLRSKLKL